MASHWEELLERILGEKYPCRICAIKMMCKKSFVSNKGGGCPQLAECIEEALQEINNENKN